MVKRPIKLIQRVAWFLVSPIPGTRTSTKPTKDITSSRTESPRKVW